MVQCIVVGCSNRTPRDTKRGITFHRLPLKNERLLSEWLVRIKRKNLPKLEHSHICSQHFEPSCFKRNFKVSLPGLLTGKSTKRNLKSDAVPTLFPHAKEINKRPASERRRNEARREEVSRHLELRLYFMKDRPFNFYKMTECMNFANLKTLFLYFLLFYLGS